MIDPGACHVWIVACYVERSATEHASIASAVVGTEDHTPTRQRPTKPDRHQRVKGARVRARVEGAG